MENSRKIAITIGDVGGIGPEIIIKAINSPELADMAEELMLIGSKSVFSRTAFELGLNIDKNIEIIDIPLDESKIICGKPTPESGKHSFLSIKKACELYKKEKVSAIATAPVSKEAINKAGYFYSGQTEILEELLSRAKSFEPKENLTYEELKIKRVSRFLKNKIKKFIPSIIKKNKKKVQAEMLFVAGDLKVMLLTRHIKLDSVTSALSIDSIIKSVLTLDNSLKNNFNLDKSRIAICGLNPHAGESGLLGYEEDYLIKPALEKLRNIHKIDIEGPFPADTLWAKTAKNYLCQEGLPDDAYVVCYHDQGLIPVKMLAMNKAVNTTINLPVIRTSPSHGTAYDIAGQNKADYQSMIESIKLAYSLGKNINPKNQKEKISFNS